MSDDLAVLNLAQFEQLASTRLDRGEFDYVAGGAADELTLADNVAAFRRWRLVPRVMKDVSAVDPTVDFLGTSTAMPVGIAPVAFQHFAHPDAEVATARAAANAGVVFCLSTMSSRSIEEVAAAAGNGRRWFQLYVHRNRERSADLVRRAQAAGYDALVVTVDFPVAGNRERDKRNALAYPQSFGNFDPGDDLRGAGSDISAIGGFIDPSFTWADLAWLRDTTTLPILLKGILAPDDAALAAENGVAGIVVSNHGGRQLDRVPAAVDQLPAIVQAVAGRAEIYVDGGVRRGTDILVALALGARGVFIGRPAIFALAVAGEAGVSRALELLAGELRGDMALLGVSRLSELSADYIKRA